MQATQKRYIPVTLDKKIHDMLGGNMLVVGKYVSPST